MDAFKCARNRHALYARARASRHLQQIDGLIKYKQINIIIDMLAHVLHSSRARLRLLMVA